MDILKKIGSFLTTTDPVDLVILAVLVLIPILAIVVLIAAGVRGAKRRRMEQESVEDDRLVVAPSQEPTAVAAPKEIERVIVYVPQQPKEQKKTKVCIKKLKKADKSLLAATAIFCVGLGAMIQRAMSGNK
jgi:hypothetical protein